MRVSWGRPLGSGPIREKKVIFGVAIVLLVWTDGQVRIPVAYRVWPVGELSTNALASGALELCPQSAQV